MMSANFFKIKEEEEKRKLMPTKNPLYIDRPFCDIKYLLFYFKKTD